MKGESRISQKQFQEFLSQICDRPSEEMVTFLRSYNRKNKDFMYDILAHFAHRLEEDGEELYELILKNYYQRILRQKTNKISRVARKIFEFIQEFSYQIQDQLALGNNGLAFKILLPCLRYSSKVLFRLEKGSKLLQIHLDLYEKLEILVEQTQAPQLREYIFKELSELASNFYYYPYDIEKNLFVILLSLKDYGHETMSDMLVDKYQAVDDQDTRMILGLYILQENLSNPTNPYQCDLQPIDIIRNHRDDINFLNALKATPNLKALDNESVSLLCRVHDKIRSLEHKHQILSILAQSRPLEDIMTTVTRHLSMQFEERALELLQDNTALSWPQLSELIIQQANPNDKAELVLIIRLLIRERQDDTKLFSLFENHFSESILKLFVTRLFEIDRTRTYSIIENNICIELQNNMGKKVTGWVNSIILLLQKQGFSAEANQILETIKSEFSHRKSLVKSII